MNYRVCFAAYLRRRGRRPSTIKSYGLALAEFCNYSGGVGKRTSLVKQMVPERIEAYKQHLLNQRGLRASTVNRRLSALSTMARFLISKGQLNGNPLDLVARAGKYHITAETIRQRWEDVQKLRAEVHRDVLNIRERAVVELLYSGLSVRELCSLRYDPSWSPDITHITASELTVTLHARACLALEHYLILRPILEGEHLLVGSGPDGSMKRSTVYGILRRLGRKSGLNAGVKALCTTRYAAQVYGFTPTLISSAAA